MMVAQLPATARRPQRLADAQASAVLLAFARLHRSSIRADDVPRRVQALMRDGTLAPRHLGMLALIALEGPLTVSELAGRDGVAVSTASLLVTQLADVGLVVRTEDDRDRRRTVVTVAEDHRRESEVVLEARLGPLRRALEKMGPDRALALVDGLGALVEELEAR
jgi:DNA-binding MarR family transcriptional regulator